mmetsp:Transcript_21407/g.44569  ORF Transcript_21407/g.44569 Transcript_21407/m.44569 type:complete len:204 (-) Transcript_21407:36-647(-)
MPFPRGRNLPPPPSSSSNGIAIAGLSTGISACVVSVAALILAIVALVRANRAVNNTSRTSEALQLKQTATSNNHSPPSSLPLSIYHIPSSPTKLYQFLGHCWDHETSDYKVLYVPLYKVEPKDSRYDSHAVAVTHFERWEEKFVRVEDVKLTEEERECAWRNIGVGGGISVPCKGQRAKVTKGKIGSANDARIGTRKWAGLGR